MSLAEVLQAAVAIMVAYLAYRKGSDRITLNNIHTLVNSNMGVQLKLNAELSRWKAEQTDRDEDREAAELAEKLYAEHQAKQGIVDERA